MSEPLKVLICDDEPPAVRRLERLIEALPEARVVDSSSDPAQVVGQCRESAPDVVLMDIEMPGTDGVSLARELGLLPSAPAVIFVTAFENYAVDAFELDATDYLVKPVREERLAAALARVRTRREGEDDGDGDESLSVRLGDRLLAIPLADVRLLQAEDKYTCVYHADGEALADESLVGLEERFARHFLRVHRNALVARDHLRALYRDEAGRDRIEIDDIAVRPEVSRRNLPAVRRALKS